MQPICHFIPVSLYNESAIFLPNSKSNFNIDLINSLDQKIHMTEQSCVGYTTQTVKNTNGELEALYKHVDIKMVELSTQIYKDFDIKKTQTNVY